MASGSTAAQMVSANLFLLSVLTHTLKVVSASGLPDFLVDFPESRYSLRRVFNMWKLRFKGVLAL
jgi:hypothetical protein